MNALMTVKDLTVSIAGNPILNQITFSLEENKIACVLGPSGCGKTTLLRCIAGLETQHQGEIWLSGIKISYPNHQMPVELRQIGMVFQDYALFPHLNVTDNITFGLNKMPPQKKQQRLDQLVELLSLSNTLKKYPHHLSGGQQQRVALARAMAPYPRLLLLDEPFANLDIELREQIAHELREILKQDNITTIMVSHNQLEAFAMADKIGVIHAGQLMQWDTAFNLYHEPSSKTVANFIGEGVLIAGQVLDQQTVKTRIGRINGKIPSTIATGQHVHVLIRPDDILHDDDSTMTACVKDKAFRGAEFLYTLEFAGGLRLLSLVPSHHNHPIGEPIGIRLEIDHLVVFPENE